MSPFEFISVMASVILALGITTLLGGVAEIIRWGRRVKSSAFFICWLSMLLAHHLGWWFGLWNRHSGSDQFTLLRFLSILQIPATLYLASRLLVPREGDTTPPDYEERFAAVRLPFFVLVSATTWTGWLEVVRGTPRATELIPISLMGVVALAGVFTRSRRADWLVLGGVLVLYVTFIWSARSSIGV